MNKHIRFFVLCVLLIAPQAFLVAQTFGPRILSMKDVVGLAQENSISAMTNRNMFLSSYWSYRSYKAELLPSLNLSGNLANFNRSLVALQDYNTGAISYRTNYNLTNEMTMFVSQNIPFTGGTLSLSTAMSRLDQYSPTRLTTYYAQPVYLSYIQSLWGYNRFKWSRQIEPKNYEVAKREYIENMEQVAQNAVMYFWNYASEKENYERALTSFDESKRLYAAARTRFNMGTISKDNLLQLELKMLNDSLSISSREVSLKSALNRLCSYIGYQEDTELTLTIDYNIPHISLVYEEVLERAMQNSSFSINQEIQSLQADQSVAQAKANRGLSASINARFGMSGSAERMNETFVALKDQEVVGVSLNIPIVDWGLGKGRVKMAQAQAETTKSRLEQNMIDYRQDLMTQVMQFNNQYHQCEISRKAAELADETYNLALRNFGQGNMSVTNLNQLKNERDNAYSQYISNVASFWSSYFGIRKTTLYDYITNTDISAEFDKLVK